MTRRTLLLPALIGLLMLAPFASTGAAEQPADAADDASLQVVSFNIRYDTASDGPNRWDNRKQAVAKILEPADLAGLQEVLLGQLNDLRQALPDFDYVGVGRDDGKQAGEFTPILYRRQRFELRDSGNFWLSETPDVAGSKGWDTSLPRICTWARLLDKRTGGELFFFNTHFDHRGAQARLESGKLIARKMKEIAGDAPALLSGDFNATPESAPIQAILTAADSGPTQLLDSRSASQAEAVGPATTWNGFQRIQPNRRIDFIFTRPAVTVLSYREITEQLPDGRFPSDHLPVQITAQVGS